MRTSKDRLRQWKKFLGWTFVISSILVIFPIPFVIYLSNRTNVELEGISVISVGSVVSFPWLMALLVQVSTLIGFVLTSVLLIRRESRDVQAYRLDLEKKGLEIEKLRVDLEAARRGITVIDQLHEAKANKPSQHISDEGE